MNTGVPQVFLFVEELTPAPVLPIQTEKDFLVTGAILFQSSYEGQEGVYQTFTAFSPGRRGALEESVEWLKEDYVEGRYKGKVLTDFDERVSRFENAVFSLESIFTDPSAGLMTQLQQMGLKQSINIVAQQVNFIPLKKAPETHTGGGSTVLSPLQPVQIVSAGQVNTIGEMSGGSITYNAASPEGEGKAVTAKKILFLGANPKETDQLRLGQEARDIEEGIRRARQRNDYQFVTKWAVRTADLRRYLLDEYPQIVHFSGHGEGANGLVFEDNSGNTQLVEAQSLANLFSLFSNTIECVVLNACFSDVQADAIAQHIPFVVGMDNAIPDVTAVQFAVAFYEALASGRGGVEFAFNYACVAIEMDKLSGQGVPQLRKKQV